MSQFIGVVGGMGPLAAADFLQKLVQLTPAGSDQEHIPVLLYGDNTIPDRSAGLLGTGPSPLPQLLAAIAFLNRAGVRAICIPCNSAHCWYAEMAAASTAPLLHIVQASAAQVRIKNPAARKVGVLSTLGTHRMGIYRQPLTELGFAVLAPSDDEFATLVSPGVALIKGNQLAEAEGLLSQAALRLRERGAEIIILGCTEIPIGMRRQLTAEPALFVDSNEALALAVIDFFQTQAGDSV